MLSAKHKNIGATAKIYQAAKQAMKTHEKGAPLQLLEFTSSIISDAEILFRSESDLCDHREASRCIFNWKDIKPCAVETCPLAGLIGRDLEEAAERLVG